MAEHGRFDLSSTTLEEITGLNATDEAIQDTLRIKYKIRLGKTALTEFAGFLISSDPTYPSWSERDLIRDYSRINEAGNPAQVFVMKKPDRFYQAYLEFTKRRRSK